MKNIVSFTLFSYNLILLFFLALRVCVVKLRQTIVEKCNSNKYLFDVLDTYDYLYVIDAHSDRMLGVMDLGLPVVFYRLIYVYDKIGMVAFCHVCV